MFLYVYSSERDEEAGVGRANPKITLYTVLTQYNWLPSPDVLLCTEVMFINIWKWWSFIQHQYHDTLTFLGTFPPK